ncbi:DUF202 domain-containing protein [Streptosporangium sp. NPDC006007]|uniref:YidH family protein n=1 Tax=Streptosporangium sp. NPDC006007 TaxID=3154575 RepID=UPI0033B2713C
MNRFPEGASPGDRASDHLANERTYLAWLRTGLSMAALGVAVAKFAPGRGMHAVISGVILLLAGLMLIFYGTSRYRTVRLQLIAGYFTPARFGAVVTVTMATILTLIAGLVFL